MINNQSLESHHIAVRPHLKRKHQPSQELNEPPVKIQKVDIKTSVLAENRCPNCKKDFKQLIRHVKKSKYHKFLDIKFVQHVQSITDEKARLKNQMKWTEFKKKKKLDNPDAMKILQNKKKAASRAQRRAENHDEMKSQHKQTVAAYRARKKNEDHDGMKSQHKQTVAAYRARKKNEDHDGMKKQHNQTNAAYRERKRNEDHEAMKLQHRQWNQTLRKVENEEHRLKAFR